MYEKRGRGIYFGRFFAADVFFLSCVSQDPDICARGRTSCSYLIPHPQISQIVFLFTASQIQSKSLSSFIPRPFKERKWAIGQKKLYLQGTELVGNSWFLTLVRMKCPETVSNSPSKAFPWKCSSLVRAFLWNLPNLVFLVWCNYLGCTRQPCPPPKR